MTDAADLHTLAQVEAAARDRLDPARWDFVEGGAGDEVTLAENRAAFRRWRLRPRVLTGGDPPTLVTTVLGLAVSSPVLVAPFAGDTGLHPDGFAAVLRACAARGTLAVVPELTTAPVGELAAVAPGAARVFQLSLLGTERDFARLAGRAADAGFAALCVTVDAPVAGVRRRTKPARAGTRLALGNFEPVTLGNFGPDSGIDPAEYFGHVQRLLRPHWSWDRLAAAAAAAGLPFVVKGILGAEDARAAVDAGAAAVYVSNHGGRQLDAAPATLDVLGEVVDAVGADAEVLLDGGVRSGPDVAMALALGAPRGARRPTRRDGPRGGGGGRRRPGPRDPRPRAVDHHDPARPVVGARAGPLGPATRTRRRRSLTAPAAGPGRPGDGPGRAVASRIATAFDPFAPGQAQDAWPLLAELRQATPVAPISGGMQYVTRYAACRAVLRDVESFSNASGFKAPGVEVPLEDRLLGELDPPRHTAVRRVMVTALTPRVVHAAAPFIDATAAALLDAVPVPGSADLVAAFTVPLPNRVTVHLLGFPAGDADQLARWAKELMESDFPATNRTERGEGFAAAFPEFAGYVDAQIDRRAAALGDDDPPDVLSRLLALTVDGAPLPRRQVRALVRNLITGGLTTTSQLLGNLLPHAAHRPDPRGGGPRRRRGPGRRGRGEPAGQPAGAVRLPRAACTRPTWPASRCTDGRAAHRRDGLREPGRDDVRRTAATFRPDRANADQHLTFGYGAHVCPGASLARHVAQLGVRRFLDHFPAGSVRLAAGYRFENVPTFFECGPRRCPSRRRRPG